VQRKKITATFDGRRIIFDGGAMLLAAIETLMRIADRPSLLLLMTHCVAESCAPAFASRPIGLSTLVAITCSTRVNAGQNS
jgi:hypothetical protein